MNVAARGRQFASVVAVVGAAVCLYSMRQADPDLWGYLTYGRLFVGPIGLIALKCVVGGVALCCLLIAVRATTRDPFIWVPVFLLCTSAICRFFVFRPQLFPFAFFAFFVRCCSSSCCSGERRFGPCHW